MRTMRVLLTKPDGTTAQARATEITVSEGADGALLPGAVLSAELTLVMAERVPVGTTVTLSSDGTPLGMFVLETVSAEVNGPVTAHGHDAMLSETAPRFMDTAIYPTTLQGVFDAWLSGTRFTGRYALPNGGARIVKAPAWGEITRRTALSYILQAAGCFARIGASGGLEIVPCRAETSWSLGADSYLTRADGMAGFGPVRGVAVATKTKDYAVRAGAGELLSVTDSPLFDAADDTIAAGLLREVDGLTLAACAFTHVGTTATPLGSRGTLAAPDGEETECVISKRMLRIAETWTEECACAVPDTGGTRLRAITPEGGVNAAALTGTVDGGLLAADSVTARSIAASTITGRALAAGSVTAEKLAAGSVTAEKLAAGAVTADTLNAESVSAKMADFLAMDVRRMSAEDVTAHALTAQLARVLSLGADAIAAGSVAADSLAAVLARAVTVSAACAKFDTATVTNLLSEALTLERGTAGQMYIRNLAVTSANLLSAAVSRLVLVDGNGAGWELGIGADGSVTARPVPLTDAECAAGETADGRLLQETQNDIAALNGKTLAAAHAVISQITADSLAAGRLTAAEALLASAAIPELYTTAVRALGDSMDLSANTSISLLVGGGGRNYLRGSEDLSGAVRIPAEAE